MAAIFWTLFATSPTGDRVIYLSAGPLPGAPAGDLVATGTAVRGVGGWTNSPLGYPYSFEFVGPAVASGPAAFSRDLSSALWISSSPLIPGGPPEGDYGIYAPGPGSEPILIADIGTQEPTFVRSSEDASRVVFTTAAHLTPVDAARETGKSVYTWAGNVLSMVDVDNGGVPLSSCGSAVSALGGVSRSAERVFFANPAPGEPCSQPSKVYLRAGNETTVAVGASECTRPDCNEEQGVTFAGATPSGSAAFLVTAQQLVNEDLDSLPDLYRYDVDEGQLELLSGDPAESGGSVLPDHLRSSADGRRVYFFAQGQLLPGLGSETGTNLYLADEAGLHFLATLPAAVNLEASDDGRFALLATPAGLDGGDTDERVDVYRYDRESGTFSWLSKGSAGNGPHDASITPVSEPGLTPWLRPLEPHALSEDGQRAFFTTAEQLVPGDTNAAQDLYEWASGSPELISSGAAAENVEFAGASADGQTVFFRTAESLLPADRDGGEHDIYAARIGGGFDESDAPGGCDSAECGAPFPGRAAPRPDPASLRPPRQGRHGKLRLLPLGKTVGEELVATGSATLAVFVPAPGSLSVRAWAGRDKHRWTVASGKAGAIRAGKLQVEVKVTAAARQRLAAGQELRVRLILRQGRSTATRVEVLRVGASS